MKSLNTVERPGVAPMRSVSFFPSDIVMGQAEDGNIVMRSAEPLRPHPSRVGDWLARWSVESPDRIFLSEPVGDGERSITYREAGRSVAEIAAGLVRFGLDANRPVIMLADNGLNSALMMLACFQIGVPIAPVTPAYALQASDFAKLKRVFSVLTPGLVVVDDAAAFGPALDAVWPQEAPLVALRNADARQGCLGIDDLRGDPESVDAVAAAAQVGPETIAKFMFTSGSTGDPKAVINTHGNFCANGQMTVQAHPFFEQEPPVMVDWLPWSHTAGSNSLRLVLYAGGTLHIDRGRPTPALIGRSVELLRRVSPTIYFNVPAGFDALLPYLESDPVLRASLFQRVKFLWYAAAPMQQSTWTALERLAVKECGERILMVSGLGMTETSPLAIFGNHAAAGVGVVGVPVPGCDAKLVPHDDKFELRYRGPNVTPGYWRNEVATRDAFDSDGFFRSGDLLSFVNLKQPQAGMRFEGRISEDFKLATGTRVSAGAVRLRALEALRPLGGDVVIAGAGRDDIRMLIFPAWEACRAMLGVSADLSISALSAHPGIKDLFSQRLAALARQGTGASNRVMAAMLMVTPPSGQAGELTDKGTISASALLRNRAHLVDQLFSQTVPPSVLITEIEAGHGP
jgi:feruloyl-CoA synthase